VEHGAGGELERQPGAIGRLDDPAHPPPIFRVHGNFDDVGVARVGMMVFRERSDGNNGVWCGHGQKRK
jgi:hypothetical protein